MPAALTNDELFDGLDASPAFVDELRRLGLLRVVALDPRGTPLWDPSARDTLHRVTALVDAGYAPRDIALIARKLGLEPARRPLRRRRPPTLWRADELAARLDLPRDTVAAWVADAVLRPSSLTEAGAPLFDRAGVTLARELADLARVGVSAADLRAWSAIAAALSADDHDAAALGDAAALIARLRAHVTEVDAATRRLDKRVASVARSVERALRRAPGVDAPPRARASRSARKRVRTSVRLREKAASAKKTR